MLLSLALVALLSHPLLAADWPQWRGPNQDGIVAKSPALVDSLTPQTMKKVWESEPLPGGNIGGYAQPAVVGDRVYVVESLRYLSLGTLVAELTEAKTVPPEELAKLGPIPEKNFACLADFEDWLQLRGVTPEAIEAILQPVGMVKRDKRSREDRGYLWGYVGTKRVAAVDVLWALDRRMGKTIYKVEFPGQWLSYAASSAPTVVNGRLYFLSSDAVAYCVDAKTGKTIWECPLVKKPRFNHCRAASPILLEGKIIVACDGEICGIDDATGKKIWGRKDLVGEEATAVPYKFGNKTIVIFAGAPHWSRPPFTKMEALDPATGQALWTTQIGRTASMPVIVDGICVLSCSPESPGPVAYKISETEAKEIWNVPFKEDKFAPAEHNYPSPIILNGHVYIAGKSKAFCLELTTGAVKWVETIQGAVLSSGILADGKIILPAGPDLVMFRPTPEKLELLGRVKKVTVAYATPALADGFLFIRSPNNVVCYDLRK